MVDERGTNIGVKIEYEDLNKVLLKIYDSDYFNFINQNLNDSAIRPYIRKRIIVDPFPRYDNKSLLQILIMFHAVSHYVKKYNPKGTPIFFLGKRPWMNVLTSYASQLGIELVPYRFSMKELKQRSMAQLRKSKYLRYLKISMEYKFSRNRDFRKIINHTNVNKRSKIIIDQVMQMYDVNTIWSSSGLLPKDVIFVSKSHNIEQNDYYDIKNAGMEFISLANSIGKGLEIPFYLPQYRKFVEKIKFIKKGNNIFENKIVDHYVEDFFSEKRYWSDMFNIVGAKIYITCHKWDYHPIAAAAAMHENGGISAFFPTSYYEFPCPDGVVYADVFFSFSPKALDIEIRHGSLIRYNVCVGNISQSRNKLFIDSARKLKTPPVLLPKAFEHYLFSDLEI